jgi:hypothetical protein
MSLTKVDKFLEDVLSYIKFPFVKDNIKFELESHILEKINYYIEQGYDSEKAEELSINDMGNPKEIGIQLNKEHNPFLGWLLRITNGMVVLFIILSALFIIPILGVSLFSKSPIKDIPKENIVYKIDIDEKVKIDDTVIRFTNVVYDKNGDMNIFYECYDTKFWGMGWSLDAIGNVMDNLGNTYFSGSGYSSAGIKSKCRKTVRDFSKEATTLIIDYDYYNRKYRVEIPLKVGDTNE